MIACGDESGGMHLAHLVGVPFGPLVVTAARSDQELTLRCPACREPFPIDPDRLGADTACSQPGCATSLRINPFVLSPLP